MKQDESENTTTTTKINNNKSYITFLYGNIFFCLYYGTSNTKTSF